MPVRRRTSRQAAVVAVLLVLTACARASTFGGSAPPPAVGLPDIPTGVACQGDPFAVPTAGGPEGPRLPADFTPVAATQCLASSEQVPGDGEWTVRVRQRTTTGLDALVAALRLPSVEPGGATCDAIGYPRIVLTLVDASGRELVPAIPRGVCGAPLPQVVAVLESLQWTTVATERVSQSRTQLEIDTGCPGRYKPTLALTAADHGTRTPSGPVFSPAPTRLQVCRYQLDPADAYSIDQGGQQFHSGRLISAAVMSGAPLATLLSALDNAPAAATCTRPEAPFALLQPAGASPGEVVVEVGGCSRALDGSAALRQLSPATVALIPS